MIADNLIVRVRAILKDVQDKSRKGEFWDPGEITLALNSAQDIFVNYCINNNLLYLITSLLTNTGYTNTTVLPSDYIHYASGQVGVDANNLRTARIYLGGNGVSYRYVAHDSIIILNNTIEFRVNGLLIGGILYYYKRPSKIVELANAGLGDFDKDFPDFVYNDIFCNHAVIILGIKEIQTQREFKKDKRNMQDWMFNPRVPVEYLRDNERPGFIYEAMRSQNDANRSG